MLGSQSVDSELFFDDASYRSITGVALAFLAAMLGGANVAGSVNYGETLCHDLTQIKDPSKMETKLTVWLTVLGLTIAGAVATAISLVLGFIVSGPQGTFLSWPAMIGAVLVGITFVVGAILLRVGNIGAPRQTNPAINTLSFLAPAFALIWLIMAGVTVPRFDLFIVGAVLIIAINVLVQLKPDEVRDASKHGKEAKRGTRIGFTALIISIWVFGTFLYVRDEIMPSSWVVSSTDGYWSLIALSATVFALMLGFRVARLTTRISHEDEAMFRLFRESEHLVRRGVLNDNIRKQLSELDTASPNQLLDVYRTIRADIISGIKMAHTTEDKAMLVSVETQLDSITHSKQQGRDIVELLSLTAFAVVTIGLGLLLRQKGLHLNPLQPSWSGFMSEVFILLFVSTVAFLCINLFDIRRERQTPLLLTPTKDRQPSKKYELFFRYKKHLKARYVGAVLISIAMSAVFCALLAVKWL